MSARVGVWRSLWVVLAASGCTPEPAALRVVSLTPLGTRALVELGLDGHVVAADAASAAWLPRALPTATLDDTLTYTPDLILIAPLEPGAASAFERVERAGVAVVEVDPRSLAEAASLYQALAARLRQPSLGRSVTNRIGDRFAYASVRQLGRPRPCIAVLVDATGTVVAGARSFESELVESVGGESLTHHDDRERVPTHPSLLREAGADLVIVATSTALSSGHRDSLSARLAPLPVAFTTLDRDALWLGDATPWLEAWQALVESARPAEFTGLLPDGCRHEEETLGARSGSG